MKFNQRVLKFIVHLIFTIFCCVVRCVYSEVADKVRDSAVDVGKKNLERPEGPYRYIIVPPAIL